MLGGVKNDEEAPDVLPVDALIEECKFKILEHRHKKTIVPAGDGTRQVLHCELSWCFFYFLYDRTSGYRLLLIFSPPVQENHACISPLNSTDIQGTESICRKRYTRLLTENPDYFGGRVKQAFQCSIP